MPSTRYRTVADYLAAQPPAVRRKLQEVRRAIRRAVPGVEERISYHMPAFSVGGKGLLGLAAWKEHLSLYPASPEVLAAYPELKRYIHSKATFRFPLDEAVPIALVEGIARVRASRLTGPAPARKPARKKR